MRNFEGVGRSDRSAVRWIVLLLVAYAAGYLAFMPHVLLVVDESAYVTQAVAFSRGALTLPGAEPELPATGLRVASNYPPGTALLQTPFVLIGGWRAAGLASVLGLAAATLFTAALLRRLGRDARFALLIPAFLPTLFFGRVAMSDVPAAALVAAALWLLWRAQAAAALGPVDESGRPRRAGMFMAAGAAAGLTLLFREPVVILLAPLVAGALAREARAGWHGHVAALIAGGVVAVILRLVLSAALFGDPLYVRDSGYGFSAASAIVNAPQYAVVLLLLVPLGLALPFAYRGPRRVELAAGFLAYFGLFLFYDYDSARENGPVKGLILTARYMIPALPVLAIMAADAYPRMLRAIGRGAEEAARRMIVPATAALAAASFLVHPALQRAETAPRSIVEAIQRHTSADALLITNHDATLKYLRPMYGARRIALRRDLSPVGVPDLLRQATAERVSLLFLDRTDSPAFADDAAANEVFLAAVSARCEVSARYDAPHGAGARLRVLDVLRCS